MLYTYYTKWNALVLVFSDLSWLWRQHNTVASTLEDICPYLFMILEYTCSGGYFHCKMPFLISHREKKKKLQIASLDYESTFLNWHRCINTPFLKENSIFWFKFHLKLIHLKKILHSDKSNHGLPWKLTWVGLTTPMISEDQNMICLLLKKRDKWIWTISLICVCWYLFVKVLILLIH